MGNDKRVPLHTIEKGKKFKIDGVDKDLVAGSVITDCKRKCLVGGDEYIELNLHKDMLVTPVIEIKPGTIIGDGEAFPVSGWYRPIGGSLTCVQWQREGADYAGSFTFISIDPSWTDKAVELLLNA